MCINKTFIIYDIDHIGIFLDQQNHMIFYSYVN